MDKGRPSLKDITNNRRRQRPANQDDEKIHDIGSALPKKPKLSIANQDDEEIQNCGGAVTKKPKLSIEKKVINPPCRDESPSRQYCEDIYKYLFEKESTYTVDLCSSLSMKYIVARARLFDWIILLSHELFMPQETLFHAVYIIDRSLHRDPTLWTSLLPLGIASLLISSKYQESFFPQLAVIPWNKEEILAMEVRLLTLHKFNMSGPQPLVFIERLLRWSFYDKDRPFREVVYLLFETSLSTPFYSGIKSSLLAASAVLGALRVKGDPWDRSQALVAFSQHSYKEVGSLTRLMLNHLCRLKTSLEPIAGMNGSLFKYCSKKYHLSVFRDPCLSPERLRYAIDDLTAEFEEFV